MQTRFGKLSALVATLLVLAGVTGCLSRSRPATLYVLAAQAEGSPPTAQAPQLVVGPIEIPAYLDRPQIVTRRTDGRLSIADGERWAQPLQDAMHRVVADNVATLTGSQRIVPALTVRVTRGHRVRGVVSRFEANETGEVALEVTWAVVAVRSNDTGSVRRSVYTEPSRSSDFSSRVQAMNRLLLRWSQDIAAEVGR